MTVFFLTVLASVWATGFLFYLACLDPDFEGWRRVLAAVLWPYLFIMGWIFS